MQSREQVEQILLSEFKVELIYQVLPSPVLRLLLDILIISFLSTISHLRCHYFRR